MGLDGALVTDASRLEQFVADARAWLEDHAARRSVDVPLAWGVGPDTVAVYRNLTFDEERSHIDAARDWQRLKSDAGYGSIDWEVEHGGLGLSSSYARAFADLEAQYVTPPRHEAITITLQLVGPTIRACGTDEQRRRFLRPLRRTDEMWCQLFSEPGAGSDLARLACRAERDGDEWVIRGQKVWTSGAQFAHWGYLLARTDPDVPKHRGLTAFLVPLRAPGVEVRPLRQMTGGSSFNEVFFDALRVNDDLRLGGVGDGWRVAMTTLGFERVATGDSEHVAFWTRVRMLAERLGAGRDPVVRQRLARLYTTFMLLDWTNHRADSALRSGQTPGPEGSIRKLAWSRSLLEASEVVSMLLGPRLVADSGEWGMFAWSEFVTGAPGSRIAGGSDEVQRNIIGERVLGLATDERVDRDVPFSQLVQGAP